VILVGLIEKLEPIIASNKGGTLLESGRLEMHSATQVVEMDESPAMAIKRKKDSSMRVSINLVKEGTGKRWKHGCFDGYRSVCAQNDFRYR